MSAAAASLVAAAVLAMAFVGLATSGCSITPVQSDVRPPKPIAETEREIQAVDQRRIDALRRNDVQAMADIYADDFTMITATGQMRTKQDQLRDISTGALVHQGPEPRILKFHREGDLAIVHSESQEGWLVVAGKADPGARRYTRVYVKRAGRWQLLATHISKVGAGPASQ